MKKDPCLLDTGPLVSFLAFGVRHHAWVVDQWKRLPPALLTCEPVLTEAAFFRALAAMPTPATVRCALRS